MQENRVFDEKVSPVSVIYAIQHILAAFNGIIAVPMVVGTVLSVKTGDLSYYVSCTIFSAGIATILQAYVFAKMPVVMGTDFTFVGPSISVGKNYGLSGIFTATLVGSFLEMILSRFIPLLKKLFPPLVTSIVVSLIGLTLLPVSVDWCAGGVGASDYGAFSNILLAFGVMLLILILHIFGGKYLESVSVFIGILAGYIIAILLGKVDFAPVKSASWFNLPEPFHFGWNFKISALLPFLIAYFVTTIETIGDLNAIGCVCNSPVSDRELEGGILGDGVGSFIGGIFNAGANTSFSQNVGIIPLTKVKSRFVVGIAGIILVLMGLFPKLGALIAIMPQPVLGGAGIVMFGMIASAGISGLSKVEIHSRELLIIAVSFACGLGVVMRPQILKNFPEWLKILLSSGISTGTIVAVGMNLVIPRKVSQQ